VKRFFNRTSALVLAFALGALLPQAHAAVGLVRWFIMTMLFVVFLETRFAKSSLQRSHAYLLAANVLMGFAGLGLGAALFGRDVALSLFFTGITPTAAAAPVIMSFLRGRVAYVVAAFVLTNLLIPALLPVLLPWVLGHDTPGLFLRVLGSVTLIVFTPMVAALLLRRVHPPCVHWPARLRNVSFGIWLCGLFLITANASQFLREHTEIPRTVLLTLAGTSALVCAANFALGRLIGGKDFGPEASQSLGQKNTAFTIYMAMTYASPLVALGPTCYVLWHNLWNSWQLHRSRHKVSRETDPSP
jgi:BASS family bile acid:Na+ symporter